ncbi:nucleolin [Rhynchospora pubera]|uniref:Nucleolin n=1 Tax=Rhynchospora pubera TaxID=906938 RepID=A0AAV8F1C4_9POAL|nr:nucleolin [Rhynchospora pubera]KAJ4787192.1 nucleolin [Rhynchospora pubera]
MADGGEKAMKKAKKEEMDGDSDDNTPISAINRRKNEVEDSDDDEKPIASRANKKKSAETKKGGEKGKALPSKAKKEELEDSKEVLQKKVKKGDNKKENSRGKENQDKKSSSGKVRTVKEKKIYDLPGQKHDPPEERDPLRIFYESLYNQVPDSEMAAFWMMEWGLLPKDLARKVFEKKKQKGVVASPAKSLSAKKSPAGNASVKRSLDTSSAKKGKMVSLKDNSAKGKKRKAHSDSEEGSDDDFIAPPKSNPKKKQKVSN